jgi:hypothetical protein
MLPIVPELINHLQNGPVSHHLDETAKRADRVVKEEHGIYVGEAGVDQQMQTFQRSLVHRLGTISGQGRIEEVPTQTDTIRINLPPR